MTRDELLAALSDLFGTKPGALRFASSVIPMNYDNLRQTISGKRPIPDWLRDRLAELKRLKES